MTEQNPIAPRKPGRPITRIIDDLPPKRIVVEMSTREVSREQIEKAAQEWLESVSPPTLQFLVAREFVAALIAGRP